MAGEIWGGGGGGGGGIAGLAGGRGRLSVSSIGKFEESGFQVFLCSH